MLTPPIHDPLSHDDVVRVKWWPQLHSQYLCARTKILHAFGFDSVRILFQRVEIPPKQVTTREIRPEGS